MTELASDTICRQKRFCACVGARQAYQAVLPAASPFTVINLRPGNKKYSGNLFFYQQRYQQTGRNRRYFPDTPGHSGDSRPFFSVSALPVGREIHSTLRLTSARRQ